jgi:hypothetical protein
LTSGSLPVIDQGQEPIAGYTNDCEMAYKGPLPVILFGDHTRIFKYVDFPFALGADGVKVLVPKKAFNPKFLFFYSTVVIWSGHIGSREDHALLLGKDLRKDLVNQGTLG